jgi:hypothetical protein
MKLRASIPRARRRLRVLAVGLGGLVGVVFEAIFVPGILTNMLVVVATSGMGAAAGWLIFRATKPWLFSPHQ